MTTQHPLGPLAVVAGVRTPFCKAFTSLSDVPADELGRVALLGALERAKVSPDNVDEVVFGNVSGQADASNLSRVIALRAGVPYESRAHTVNRNCASGMEAIFAAWHAIQEGRAEVIVAGGTESMSRVPFLWDRRMQSWLMRFQRASLWQRAKLLGELRPRHFRPIPSLELGLTDPTCGLNMGQTAEVLAKEFAVTREEQDAFALRSHQLATAAWDRCFYGGETTPVTVPRETHAKSAKHGGGVAVEAPPQVIDRDVGPRANQSLEALAKLKPIFDRRHGTVTAGNSCPITDGAAALVLMPASRAETHDAPPLGFIRDYAIAGCDPARMGLGPVFAIHKLLKKTGMTLADFDLFEINEAFAAQVLACRKALASADFAEDVFHESRPDGEIPLDRLNVNGGAIALGHPVGTSGTRLVLTLLRALREKKLKRGLAALCVGGGQGVAVWVEA